MHEWPLLIFTVFTPAAIGGVLFLYLIHRRVANSNEEMISIMKLPLFVIVAISFIGLAASFLHLGSPENAFNAVRGFGRSWMSNEIVVTGAFIALICLTAGLMMIQKKVTPILLVLTGVIGLVDIYCMATAYAVTRVNGWHHINTYVVFYGTAFALGPILGTSLILPKVKGDQINSIVKRAFSMVLFGVAIQIIGSSMLAGYNPEVQMIEGQTAINKLAPYNSLIGIRWVIELLGLSILGYMSMTTNKKISYSLVYAALLVFAAAEGMSRYVFYVLGS
ncbi:dimethyl sulfoxide reductase anchor subunit family protein [Neobacillus muris]|uniref:dimethyl sulfoxide reductase anchor subunit family protein n=1 Tax=Neobacillus muris TaxID=2941334 RepID=UPI002041AF7F|nr:DmsC/YnfH family molybdoenzyme membrane anchor subunit [Neobacillus muris]